MARPASRYPTELELQILKILWRVGPATGRDGLAGAAFASKDLTDESAQQQRGAVQVGDPFMEKLVCEACLELLATYDDPGGADRVVVSGNHVYSLSDDGGVLILESSGNSDASGGDEASAKCYDGELTAPVDAPPPGPAIKPPFYKTWWFWTAAAVVVAGVVGAGVGIAESQPAGCPEGSACLRITQ